MNIVHVLSWKNYDCANVRENCASCCRGVWMYVRNAALFHRPSARMVESSRPAFAAAVAAPMRKLWPAKCWYGRPTAIRASLTDDTKYDFVSGIPFSLTKNGPADAPLLAMY